jgi:hypothetical protein
VVEEIKRLGGNGAAAALGGAGIGVRTIEEREERMPLNALRHQVHTSLPGVVNGFEGSVLGEAGVLWRERVPLAGFVVEFAGEREQGVADFLSLEATTGEGGVISYQ